MLTIRAATGDGSRVSVSGTLTGPKQIEKIVEINGYDVEVPIAEHFIVMIYTDRPGIVAIFGHEFGDGRHQHRRHADRPHRAGRRRRSACSPSTRRSPEALLERLRAAIEATLLREIDVVAS